MRAIFAVIGIIFGSLAGLMAFLITFNEWKKHQFNGWELWREPLIRAFLAFAFFFLLSLMLGYLLPFVV